MTEPNSQAPAVDPNAPFVNPQAIYIKDVSFEAPNGPFLQSSEGAPSVNLNLATRAAALAQDLHEVVHRDDRGVLELPLHARLAHEARERAGRARLGADPLDRDLATDRAIEEEIHRAHAALTEERPVLVSLGEPRVARDVRAHLERDR